MTTLYFLYKIEGIKRKSKLYLFYPYPPQFTRHKSFALIISYNKALSMVEYIKSEFGIELQIGEV